VVQVAGTEGAAACGNVGAAAHIAEGLLHLMSSLVSLAVIAMMFKWLPDATIDWYDVWLGAVLTAILFEIGKSAIAFYIGKQGLESTYRAAASIIVVLIWVYYTSQNNPDGRRSHACFRKTSRVYPGAWRLWTAGR
jgi:membrane protein